jgi:cephalosporin-C deacetylase
VYNELACPKTRLLYEGFGHEEIQDFDDLIIGFFGEVPAEGGAR